MLRHRTLARSKFLEAVGLDCLSVYVASRSLAPPHSLVEEQVAKWLEQLNEAERAAVLEDWQSINDVADYAVDALDLAYRRSLLTPDDSAPRERVAMTLFLDDRESFEIAADLYDWRDATMRMSHYRLPEHPDRSPLPNTDEFQSMVSKHFRESMRSDDCIVHAYEEAGVWIMLVAHGDYQQTQQRWSPDGPRPDFFRPARQDVLQYNPVSGVFSLRMDGRPTTEDQQLYITAFSERCLGIEARNIAELETTISLQPIRDEKFRYSGNEDVEWVRLAAADLRFPARRTAAVIRSDDVLSALKSELRGTRLGDAELGFVKLHFKLRGKKGRARAVTLKPPARSEISRDAAVIEAYLREERVLLA